MKKKAVDLEAPEKIIGRQKEQELLRELIGSNKSEFIAIYGRRRVGKTYLIKNLDKLHPVRFLPRHRSAKGTCSGPIKGICKANWKSILSKSVHSPTEELV